MARQFLTINKEYAGDRIQGERNYQEDDFGFDNSQPNDFFMVLADGMGGHQGGEIASRCAIEAFMDAYHAVSGTTVAERLLQGLRQTNRQLALEVQSNPKLRGMGCTLVGVAITNGEQLEWISVGDSPLWLYSRGRLHRLNADHSMKPVLQELVERGELTPEEAARHPKRNMLRAAIMGTQIDLIDKSSAPEPLELLPGERLLLASDGILTLSEAEIANILGKSLPAKDLVDNLLAAVEKKGKRAQDNTTVLVVEIAD